MQNDYIIIYGLKLFSGGVQFYYPEAYLADHKNAEPQYIKKLATEEVLNSYQIDYVNTPHKSLIDWCQALNPQALEDSFQKKNGKRQSLQQLFESDVVKQSIKKKVDKLMSSFLELARSEKIAMYLNPQRKIHLENLKIKYSPFSLQPLLRFEKTVTGTNYQLFFCFDNIRAFPRDLNTLLINQEPAIIVHDHTLFEIQNFDGKKIMPFLEKTTIHIPARITKEYFTKFIKDVIAQVDVEVEGFEYLKPSTDPVPLLKFSIGIADDQYELILVFQYGDVRFNYGDKASNRVLINIDENNEIKVTQINRNIEQEEKAIQYIEQLGFQKTAAFRYRMDSEDMYASIFNIATNSKHLKQLGWQILFPDINNKEINFENFNIVEHIDVGIDWFDIHGHVAIGAMTINFAALIQHIKKENRIYNLADGSVFIIPLEWMQKYEKLARFGEEVDSKIKISKANYTIVEELDIAQHHQFNRAILTESDFEYAPSNQLHATMRPYQFQGAKWLVKHYKNGMGACLADDMGLGKTLQTLALLCHVKDHMVEEIAPKGKAAMQLNLFENYATTRKALQALIVVPASLIFNWEREIKKFAPQLMVKVHAGADRTKSKEALVHFDIILTSYPIVLKDNQLLEKIEYEYIVIDEAHYIKNRESKIFKAINSLETKNRISLSGTPIENSLADLWSQMQFINPDILLSYPQFKKMYQDPIEKHKDEVVLAELKTLLHPFILRRTKKEVLTDLPEFEEHIHYCCMEDDQKKLVESEKSKARNTLLSAVDASEHQSKIHVFNALMKLRQLANHPKLIDKESKISSCKYIEVTNAIDSLVHGQNKILIFSTFLGQLDIYKSFLEKNGIGHTILTGSNDSKSRAKAVDDFQLDEHCQVMLISITAGNTGLNLTAANYVLLLDPWWNPFIEEQAKSRAHRIGQERQVTVIKFITKDSIEEKILLLQERKKQLSMDFMDESSMPEFDKETLGYLLS